MPGWVHVSIGDLLRSMTSTNVTIHDAIVAGEMVPQDIVMQLVEQQVLLNRDTDGIILSGFPRNFSQVDEFENKVYYLLFLLITPIFFYFNLCLNLFITIFLKCPEKIECIPFFELYIFIPPLFFIYSYSLLYLPPTAAFEPSDYENPLIPI